MGTELTGCDRSELKSKETITLVLEIDVPADAKELIVEAEVTYPPD